MARQTLSQLKAQLLNKSPSGRPDVWNPADPDTLGENQSAKIRFLPFMDEVSGGFWTIRQTLKAQFVEEGGEPFYIYIPCREQYPEEGKCEVADVVRNIYEEADKLTNDKTASEALRKVGKEHWKQLSYYFAGYVDDNPTPTAIRLPKQVFNIIDEYVRKNASQNPAGEAPVEDIKHFVDSQELPEGYSDADDFGSALEGETFRIKKVKRAGMNNYQQSDFTGERSMLTTEQIEGAASASVNTRNFISKKPTNAQFAVYAEMMKASIEAAIEGKVADWNPEWEEAGIKPFRKGEQGDGGSQTDPALAAKEAEDAPTHPKAKVAPKKTSIKGLKAKLNAKAAEESGDEAEAEEEEAEASEKPKVTSAQILAKLKANRGAKAA